MPREVITTNFKLIDIPYRTGYDAETNKDYLILELPSIAVSSETSHNLRVAGQSLQDLDGVNLARFENAVERFLEKENTKFIAKMLAAHLKRC